MKLGITHQTKRLMVGLVLAVVLLSVSTIMTYAQESETLRLLIAKVSPTGATFDVASGATFNVTLRIYANNTGPDSARTFNGNYTLSYSGLTLESGPSAIGPCTPSTSTAGSFNALGNSNPCSSMTWTFKAPTGPATGSITLNVSSTATSEQTGRTNSCPSAPGSGDVCVDSVSYTVNVLAPTDTTPPVITPNVSGTLGNNGWYVSDITVSWTVSDPESPITLQNGCGTTSITTDTAGQTLTCTATSAGGTSSQSVTIKRDATKPTLTGSRSPAANSYGWNNTDVTVSFSCTDGLAGVATPPVSPQVVSTEGAGQSRSATCTDNAGNTASVTVNSINIDKTKPTASASASPGPNANGWNKTDVTVTFTGNDNGGSGIASCDAPVTLSSEGAGQSASGTCTDKAGNVSAPATASGINIDKTPPTLAPSVSPNPVVLNGSATASPNASDNLSGVATSSCGSVNTSAIGSYTVNCTATDNADNTATASVSYNVIYNFGGFLPPLTADGRDTFKKGSVVPVKFQLKDANGNFVTNATASLTVFYLGTATAPADEPVINIVGAGDSGNTFRYDLTSNQYIFNWSTKGLNWTGKFRLIVNLYGASSPFNPSVEIYLK